MSAWNISLSKDLIKFAAQNMIDSNKNPAATNSSDYATILSQKIAQVEQGLQEIVDNQLSQSQISVNVQTMPVIETIKRFRPDGSIMITTYKDGQIDATQKIKPHLVPMPDFSAPETPEGKPETKFVPRLSVAELLMLQF